MSLRGSVAVFRFEWSRTLTLMRIFWLAALSLFPALMMALLLFSNNNLYTSGILASKLFDLIPEVVCLMGLLLWATPIIQSELEGKTWVYLAVRPGGRVSVLFGKYATAVSWTMLTALLSLAFAMLVAHPPGAFQIWWVLSLLVILSSLAYGALFSTLGVLFPRRAMVIAVVYTLVFEFLVSQIPAVIQQLTVKFRLRSLLLIWMDNKDLIKEYGGEANPLIDTTSAGMHVMVLLLYTVVLLAVAAYVLRRKEYIKGEQD